MKKYFVCLLFLLFPIGAKAADYKIPEMLVDAKILENGDVHVQELILLNGSFNGYERSLDYRNGKLLQYKPGSIDFAQSSIYNAKDIVVNNVSAKALSTLEFSNFSELFEEFNLTASASLGSTGYYTQRSSVNGYALRTYRHTEKGKTAFYYDYTIKSAVVIHNDLAELYWQFIGFDFTDEIGSLKIKVNLPQKDTTDSFRFWVHGPLNGDVSENNKKEVFLEVKNLKESTPVDTRITFDKNLISNQANLNHSNETALEKILEVEEARAAEANATRKRTKTIYYSLLISIVAYLVFLVLLFIYVYFKYDKEYQSNFKLKYNREFINDYDVEVVDYLMNHSITQNAMSASILNLIYKKNITAEEIPGTEKEKDYVFHLINDTNLSEAEKYLIDFLFNEVGNEKEKTFTTKELKAYASATSTYTVFTTKFSTWKNKVTAEGEKQDFYESKGKIKTWCGLYGLLGIILFVVNLVFHTDITIGYAMIVPTIIFLIYILCFTRRTKKGNDHFVRWKAFKNFLNDFGTFENKELPEIILWERYLVYATVFGIAEKVQKSMNVKISEMDPNNTIYTSSHVPFLYYISLNNVITNSVNTAVRESITKATAQSNMSSGGGFGGGFSSGGGFGGGGGGGHGF